MSYLNCPRCGLTIHRHEPAASAGATEPHEPATCPRCRGRAEIEVPMFVTDRPRPPVNLPAGDRAHRSEPQAA